MARYYDKILRNGKTEYRVFDETSCLYYSFYHEQVTPLCEDVEVCIQNIVEAEQQYITPDNKVLREQLANKLRQHGPYMIYDLDAFFGWIGTLRAQTMPPYEEKESEVLHAAVSYLKQEPKLLQKPSAFFDVERFFQTIAHLTKDAEKVSDILGFTAQYLRAVEDAYRCYEMRRKRILKSSA